MNGDEEKDFHSISINDNSSHMSFTVGNGQFNQSKLHSYWYRRGHPTFNDGKEIAVVKKDLANANKKAHHELINFFNGEYQDIEGYFNFSARNVKFINGYTDNNINKLISLELAKKAGLHIPPTIITSRRSELESFLKQHSEIIYKAIRNGLSLELKNGKKYYGFTKEVNISFVRQMPDSFFPSLFQKKLDKKFELRIFYLRGRFFASAIFSQNDNQTKVDFRNYNFRKPNRTPPFRLPNQIRKKLRDFMRLSNLNCGSIDMVYTNEKQFVFLEVNPIGQFAQVSLPCNYYIEREIAKIL